MPRVERSAEFARAARRGGDNPRNEILELRVGEHAESGLGGATRRGHVASELTRIFAGFDQQRRGTEQGLAGQPVSDVGREPLLLGCSDQRLGQEEDICRPRPAEPGDGVEIGLVDDLDTPDRTQDLGGPLQIRLPGA